MSKLFCNHLYQYAIVGIYKNIYTSYYITYDVNYTFKVDYTIRPFS